MIRVFGSKMCVDCKKCELNFNACKIECEFVDINESLENLKRFLAIGTAIRHLMMRKSITASASPPA